MFHLSSHSNFLACPCTSTAAQPLQAAKGSKAWTFLLLLRPSSTVFQTLSSHSNFPLALAPAQPLQAGAHHHHRLQKGQKHELFYCCSSCCLTQAKQHCVSSFKFHSNFPLALAPAQPLQAGAPPLQKVKSMNFSTACSLAVSAQAKQHCVPFNFHSNFLALATAPAQAKQHCVPFNFHSNFLACPCTSSGQAALCSIQFSFKFSCPCHCTSTAATTAGPHSLLSSTKGGNRLWFTVCTSLPGQQAKQHHFISQLLKFPTTKGGNRLWFTLWLSPRPSSTISSFNFWNLFPSWIFWARRVEMNNGSFVWILHGPKITPHIFQMEDPKNIEFFSKFWYKIREAKIAPCHLTTTNQTFLKSVGMDKMIWKGFRPLRPSRSKLLAFEIYEAKISLFTTSAKNWTRNVQNFKTNHKIAEVEKSKRSKVQQTVSRSRPNWRNGSLVNFSYWIYWIKESV